MFAIKNAFFCTINPNADVIFLGIWCSSNGHIMKHFATWPFSIPNCDTVLGHNSVNSASFEAGVWGNHVFSGRWGPSH